jgi:protein-arginine kinase activator protein McsA
MPTEQTCEECNERPAVVHITRWIENREEQHHFCVICGAPHVPPMPPGKRAVSGWSITSADGQTQNFPDE